MMSSALSRTRSADSPVSSSVLRSHSTMANPSTVFVACARASAPSNPLTSTLARVAAFGKWLERHVDVNAVGPVECQVTRRFEARHDNFLRGAGHHELPLHARARSQRTAGVTQPEFAQASAD